jgi:CRP-like cAMP-binding protein
LTKSKSDLGQALGASEKKARLRDIETEQILTSEEMAIANELQNKANTRGMKLVPDRKVKSKVRFVQFIQDNWDYLITNDYFGNDELLLLMKISGKVGFLSNCIVHDIHAKSQIPMTQSDIASYLGINKGNLSRIIKSLIDKGVIVRAVGFKEGINARAYSLYLNPHIIYSGDRDNIPEPLKTMFYKTPKALKNLPVRLF